MVFPSGSVLVHFALIASTIATAVHLPRTVSTILWDGRIPKNFTPKSFDNANVSPYNVAYNKGKSQYFPPLMPAPPPN
jgi:hypothetical protein